MKDKEFLEQSEKHLIENQAEVILKEYEEEFKIIRNNRMKEFLITGRVEIEKVEFNGKWVDKEIVNLINKK